MEIQDWKRDELFMLFSKRTNRKNAENYILNAIWHKIGNLDLQPVTQQCIQFGDNRRALIDLYFPQINYGVECDEAYHKNNTFNDLERANKIEKILSSVNISDVKVPFKFKLKRIDATASILDINKSIDKTVHEINERIKELRKPPKWKNVEERIVDVIKEKSLCDSDMLPFPTQASVGPCFGRYPKTWQRSYFKLNDEYYIWFPKLALNINGKQTSQSNTGWINILNDDWSEIIEKNTDNNKIGAASRTYEKRVVFAKSKDLYGKNAYRFIGVFKLKDNNVGRYNKYERIDHTVDLKPFLNY